MTEDRIRKSECGSRKKEEGKKRNEMIMETGKFNLLPTIDSPPSTEQFMPFEFELLPNTLHLLQSNIYHPPASLLSMIFYLLPGAVRRMPYYCRP